MDVLAELLGLLPGELMQLIILGIVLFVGLILVRVLFRLTATLFRLGCFFILLIVGGVFFLRLFSG
jgi:hypothetical protein